MIGLNSKMHLDIVKILRDATYEEYPVYNLDTIIESPLERTRIEYSIGGAYSTGDMYRTIANVDGIYSETTVAEYGSDLTITIIGSPDMVDKSLYNIVGLLQSTGVMESYGTDFALSNETLVVVKAPIVKAGIIFNIGKIKLNITYASKYAREIEYFTTVKADYDIKEN